MSLPNFWNPPPTALKLLLLLRIPKVMHIPMKSSSCSAREKEGELWEGAAALVVWAKRGDSQGGTMINESAPKPTSSSFEGIKFSSVGHIHGTGICSLADLFEGWRGK